MSIDEKTRLDLRRAFEELIGPDLAAAAMEAMPNVDYDELATKADVEQSRLALHSEMGELRTELRGEITELRGEMTELRADLRTEMAEMHRGLESRMASNLRTTVLTHVGSVLALGGFFAGIS